MYTFPSGQANVWIGAKEPDGSANDPTLVTFTDGSTHDYIPPDVSLNDEYNCIRLTEGGPSDKPCHFKYSFMCMSRPVDPQGNHFLVVD